MILILCRNPDCHNRETCARAQTLPDKHGQPSMSFPLSRKADKSCGEHVSVQTEEK